MGALSQMEFPIDRVQSETRERGYADAFVPALTRTPRLQCEGSLPGRRDGCKNRQMHKRRHEISVIPQEGCSDYIDLLSNDVETIIRLPPEH
jgi:hypothetical protein